MSQQKYMPLRLSDVRSYLTQEQKKSLWEIVNAIKQGRERDKKSDDVFFVLNARDLYAQPAIEAYIDAAQNDLSLGTILAVQAARSARERGLMSGEQKLPSIP